MRTQYSLKRQFSTESGVHKANYWSKNEVKTTRELASSICVWLTQEWSENHLKVVEVNLQNWIMHNFIVSLCYPARPKSMINHMQIELDNSRVIFTSFLDQSDANWAPQLSSGFHFILGSITCKLSSTTLKWFSLHSWINSLLYDDDTYDMKTSPNLWNESSSSSKLEAVAKSQAFDQARASVWR